MKNLTDKELVDYWRVGDHSAFDALHARYWSRVRRHAQCLSSRFVDREECESIADTVFALRAGDYHGDAQFSTFMFRCVKNAIIDAHRRELSRQHVSLEKLSEDPADNWTSFDSMVDDDVVATTFAYLKDRLSESDITVLRSRFEGDTWSDAMQKIGKSRSGRAVQCLSDRLKMVAGSVNSPLYPLLRK
ncbi:MAG: sigma-70 family RNA polymerase sigma factor [Nanoarchaeota archaeon]|nr:sigma-70 family RNA polymerase sigma factor [Nanoarchaeota archaeon]